MLIKCSECGKENISSHAKSCPSCGYPIAATTIETTGKKWKTIQALGSLAIIVGVIFTITGLTTLTSPTSAIIGVLLLFGGLVSVLTAGIGAWWHHG